VRSASRDLPDSGHAYVCLIAMAILNFLEDETKRPGPLVVMNISVVPLSVRSTVEWGDNVVSEPAYDLDDSQQRFTKRKWNLELSTGRTYVHGDSS
jgi:hypothetical protein